jgi:hypothetical protein
LGVSLLQPLEERLKDRCKSKDGRKIQNQLK